MPARGRLRSAGVSALPLLITLSVVASAGAFSRSSNTRRADVDDAARVAAADVELAGAHQRHARIAFAGPTRTAGVVRDGAGTWRLTNANADGAATIRVAGLPDEQVQIRFTAPAPLGWSREVWVAGQWRAASSRGVRVPGRAADFRLRASAGAAPLEVQWLDVRWSRAPGRSHPGAVAGYVHVETPEVIGRESWGAHDPFEPYDPHSPVAIVVHHSWLPTQQQYGRTGGAESVAGIQRFHMFDPARGWNDVGYHYLIGPDGLIFAGRPPEVVGAHAVPNTGKVGICMIGNHDPDGAPPTRDAWRSLEELVVALADRYDIPVTELYGHRNFSYKTCPGDLVYDRFPELRMEVLRRIGTMGTKE